ncbi:MAG: ABC transporter ATP-binding protein [Nitriliruptor sp.]|uniref:ABC transporter ATP-binding protein n=1 Tax=Nitriliruptor sp. TaxID=2448056 RepID=UPI0034A064F1
MPHPRPGAAPPPDVGAPAIEVSGLVKRYGPTTAVDGLDLEVAPGETLALLGPNGAGKTTTVECCEGYRRPDAGTVRVLGLDPRRDARALRPRVGLMLQEGGVYPLARPAEVLRLFAAFHLDPLDPDELLERVGLGDARRTRFRDLSGGQKQRLSLALAVVGRPEVLFLDEPTAGLDPAARRATWDHVRELRSAGVTVVLTTHLLDEAEELADRVAIIDGGRLVALGTPDELTHGERDEFEFTARPGLDLDVLTGAVDAPVTEPRPGRYLVHAAASPGRIARLAAWLESADVALGEIRAGKRSLEDVFLRLTTAASEAAPDPVPARRRGGRR